MSLVGNLKEIQEKAIDEKVLEFAEEMEGVITESAAGGLYCTHWGWSEEEMKKMRDYAREIGYLKAS